MATSCLLVFFCLAATVVVAARQRRRPLLAPQRRPSGSAARSTSCPGRQGRSGPVMAPHRGAWGAPGAAGEYARRARRGPRPRPPRSLLPPATHRNDARCCCRVFYFFKSRGKKEDPV
ncbi:hypothetical protein PVAP13_1KG191200 [Panicum virgatum]|uniref:Secreted protein n=2 Tax=Panicum virgatum TaxID=38727 RepID=A0A8T0XIK0_PANVG|nr:hypothetical protein PVAP13_1KG191200 [Panicum virgatum]